MSVRILTGDCRDVLKTLPSESIHCIVTSPPYYGLRDYGTAKWEGGDDSCDHLGPPMRTNNMPTNGSATFHGGTSRANEPMGRICKKCGASRTDSQIGLEATPDAYVKELVSVFSECRRVLKSSGTCWINLGDSYNAGRNGGHAGGPKQASLARHDGIERSGANVPGLKPKDLIGIPWLVAFALRADGWYLRQDIIWSKPNPMPESVRDRCTKAHEYLFLLSKSERYYFDQEAISEPVTFSTVERLSQPTLDVQHGSDRVPGKTNGAMKAVGKRIPTAETRLSGSYSEGAGRNDGGGHRSGGFVHSETRNRRSVWEVTTQPFSEAHFATFPPALIEPCIKAGCPEGGTVLDPFGGAGTTGLVADRLQRNAILIELNPEYAAMSERRLNGDAPLFAPVAA